MHSVFIRHYERLRRLVVAMGLSVDEGQDILQDVYVEAVQKPLNRRDEDETTRWLMRVTANRCLLEFRRRKRHQQAAGKIVQQWAELKRNVGGPDMQAIHAEEVQTMMQCLSEMNETFRVPLAMRYFCNLNSTEIGEILDLEPGTIRKRLHTARIILSDALLEKGIKP